MRDKLPFIAKGLRYTSHRARRHRAGHRAWPASARSAPISRNPVAYGVAGFYVSFFRGTPLIVQMFLLYLALPQVGRNLRDQFPGPRSRDFEQAFVLDAHGGGRSWRSGSTTAPT